jgi:hypothetical protein
MEKILALFVFRFETQLFRRFSQNLKNIIFREKATSPMLSYGKNIEVKESAINTFL